MSRTIPILNLA
jgi:hypothetical protein